LGLVAFLLARVDQLPILAGLEGHFAEQGLVAFELSANDLSEEEDLGDEVGLGSEVFETL
jgi:hypothetical protein